MYIEVHLLQNFAPSNLNRDDTGNPKDCEFGGARRARISSQCLKRAIRNAPIFAETTKVELGKRTRWVTRQLRETLEKAGKSAPEIQTVVEFFVPGYLSKFDAKYKAPEDAQDKSRTAVLLYLSPGEIANITDALLKNWDALLMKDGKLLATLGRDLVKVHQNVTGAPDIALFGRMLAEKPDLNLDAACQVAHAISTHRVTMEMDFFTAVDELLQEDEENTETGAGMMGFTGFESACFYRYARLDWGQLLKNLDGDVALARRTVEAFLRAVEAIPTGKQNTFAAHNPPSFRLAVAREGGFAWSLANAFEKPVHPRGDSGLVTPSVEALEKYWSEQLLAVYGADSIKRAAALAPGLELTALQEERVNSLDAWVKALVESLPAEA
ncbi:MAG: type I-E CRISPR-associated protein Cas7/Cse4/CasC [Anaerolineae bacterium]|nr:type I-E CRISPR-associated protein Cas7/Cse4/CasC [Anaerolineae bacterium]